MGINKINLKQIDADFSGLVGQYGSGYFTSTGQFNSLSNSTFKYTDLPTTQFVYQTGNQNISGSKTFFSRPILTGAGITYHASGIARLGEVVTIAGSETITGPKTFLTNATFNSNVNTFEYCDVEFTETNFIFDPDSSASLVSNLGTLLVNTTSNQAVGGVKNFTAGLNVKGTGVLVSGAVNPIYVNLANSNTERYIVFTDGTGSGSKFLLQNSGLSYSPLNKRLTCETFAGNLNGVASFSARLSGKNPVAKINNVTFDGSADIIVAPNTALDSSANERPLLFQQNGTVGYNSLYFDSDVTVNPAANSISASTFKGGFSGNALNATSSANLSIGTFAATDNINFQFPAGTTAYQLTNTFFAPNSDNTRALGQASPRRWSTVYAGTPSINTSDSNFKTEISEIPDSWLDAWEDVNYVRYKFKDAVVQKGLSGARWHVGHIAQDIHEKFQVHGLDAFEIGMLCYDKWEEHVDVDGKTVPSGEIWSIRPDECQFMEMALTRRTLNRLKSGILS